MLQLNGIIDVKTMSVTGELTDHYPVNKTVTLSRDVYFGNHIASGACSGQSQNGVRGHCLFALLLMH